MLVNIKNSKLVILVLFALIGFTACETEFVNPNAPTDAQILSTKEGLLNLAVGVRQVYSTTGLRWLLETPAITTREGAITTTFQNMIELEDGGAELPDFNSNVEGLWATMLRVNGMATDLIDNAKVVNLEAGTEAGLIVFGHLFKAMSIGALAQHYDQVIVETSADNSAKFVSRMDAYNSAITLLEQARDLLQSSTLSAEFLASVPADIDLENTIQAYLARYSLFAGNYDAAITAANAVDLSTPSLFTYDILNTNPVWGRVFQNDAPNFKPRDNFGLPSEFTVDPADGRVAFYLAPLEETNQNGLPIEDLVGFFQTDTESIPVYLPGEVSLIIAEAQVRKSAADLDLAVAAINAVRTKTDDIYGVNADLGAYTGEVTTDAVLDEIYRNRRIELFLTGLSLEDSRRFGRMEPSGMMGVYSEERNRNFYPFPLRERSNNPNTPPNPSI